MWKIAIYLNQAVLSHWNVTLYVITCILWTSLQFLQWVSMTVQTKCQPSFIFSSWGNVFSVFLWRKAAPASTAWSILHVPSLALLPRLANTTWMLNCAMFMHDSLTLTYKQLLPHPPTVTKSGSRAGLFFVILCFYIFLFPADDRHGQHEEHSVQRCLIIEDGEVIWESLFVCHVKMSETVRP